MLITGVLILLAGTLRNEISDTKLKCIRPFEYPHSVEVK
jgi:hypothetical protein